MLNEYRDDLRTECEKFGTVKKVILFDVSAGQLRVTGSFFSIIFLALASLV